MSVTETVRKTEEVPEWKQEEIEELSLLLDQYDTIAVANHADIPSRQLQEIRRKLHGSVEIRVSRNTLLKRALKRSGTEYEQLTEYVTGPIALIATNLDPFRLFAQLEASKMTAPINAGDTASTDILLPEGDTGIDPGPFIGELQEVGAMARLKEGSITVTETSQVLREGETVSPKLANVLNKLEIEPKEVGLDLKAAYSNGAVYTSEEFAIDTDEYRTKIQESAQNGYILSLKTSYPTKKTIVPLLQHGQTNAIQLGTRYELEAPEIIKILIEKCSIQSYIISEKIDVDDATTTGVIKEAWDKMSTIQITGSNEEVLETVLEYDEQEVYYQKFEDESSAVYWRSDDYLNNFMDKIDADDRISEGSPANAILASHDEENSGPEVTEQTPLGDVTQTDDFYDRCKFLAVGSEYRVTWEEIPTDNGYTSESVVLVKDRDLPMTEILRKYLPDHLGNQFEKMADSIATLHDMTYQAMKEQV